MRFFVISITINNDSNNQTLRNMHDTGRDVALSEVIGFVLLLALVVSALSLYMIYVVPLQGREAEIIQMNRINEQFTDYKFTLDNIRTSMLINNLSPVMTSTSLYLGTGGGNMEAGGFFMYLVKPRSSSATLSVNATGDQFNIDSSSYHGSPSNAGEFPLNVTALEYSSDNNYWIQQRYSYQLGGVFLYQLDGVTNRVAPLISITNSSNKSVVVNIAPVNIVGGGQINGNGPARVDTRMRVLPKYNISTDPFIPNTWVNLSYTSADNATASMWLTIFKDIVTREKLDSSAYTTGSGYNSGTKKMTAFINITGSNPDPGWPDVSLYVQRTEFFVAFNNIASGVT